LSQSFNESEPKHVRWRDRPENKDAAREQAREYRIENKSTLSENMRRWRANNRELARQRSREQYHRQPDEHNARSRLRKKDMRWSYLSYIHRKEISIIYAEARRKTEETGILYVVDHIWPIKGKNSCGLHVPWNLQIITGAENDSKGNKEPSNYQHLSWPSLPTPPSFFQY
jgi:5-methylcytosine-specific restriction endonuclease McrA